MGQVIGDADVLSTWPKVPPMEYNVNATMLGMVGEKSYVLNIHILRLLDSGTSAGEINFIENVNYSLLRLTLPITTYHTQPPILSQTSAIYSGYSSDNELQTVLSTSWTLVTLYGYPLKSTIVELLTSERWSRKGVEQYQPSTWPEEAVLARSPNIYSNTTYAFRCEAFHYRTLIYA